MLDNISRYVYEVYRSRSVTEAAKKLFISQPALSASIKKAECELGAPIFNRKTLPFSLTAEGKLYIRAIEQILRIEEETKSSILDMGELKSGTVTVATSTHVSFYAIPRICQAFAERYPGIDINVVLDSTENLPSLLEKKTADLIFIPGGDEPAGCVCEVLFEERCIIAVRRDYGRLEALMPYALSYEEVVGRRYGKEKMISDLSLLQGVEFIYSPPHSNLYKKKKILLGDAGIAGHVTASSSRHQLNYNLMRSGFGALFTTDAAIATTKNNEDCIYFAIDDPEATQSFLVAYAADSDSHVLRIAKELIDTAKMLFNAENPLAQLTY